MNKLKSFVWLDLITIKPYFTAKNMLIFAAIAFFLTVVSYNLSSVFVVGMVFGLMFTSYPFAAGEKTNMDALYVILAIGRKTVVLGRYVFALFLNMCAIVFSFIFALAGFLATRAANFGNGIDEVFWMVILFAMLFAVIEVIQLPFFFKFGYTKARFLSVLPFIAIMGGYFAYISMRSKGGFSRGVTGFFINMLGAGGMIGSAVLVLLLLIFASYKLSLSFYSKREF
jgi:hypothetical protein